MRDTNGLKVMASQQWGAAKASGAHYAQNHLEDSIASQESMLAMLLYPR